MTTVLQRRIREMMDHHSISGNEVARRVGGGLGIVRDILSGKVSDPRVSTVQAIAEVLGVSYRYLLGEIDTHHPADSSVPVARAHVCGKVAAGMWLEVDDLAQDPADDIPVLVDSRFPSNRYQAWQVVGDSMDVVAPDGSFVIAIPWAETGLSLATGMVVVVEQRTAGGSLVERTVKRAARTAGGGWMLEPMSSNPKNKPIRFDLKAGTTEVVILGLALSSTNIIRF